MPIFKHWLLKYVMKFTAVCVFHLTHPPPHTHTHTHTPPLSHTHAHTPHPLSHTQIGGSSSGDAMVNASLVNRVGETVGTSIMKVSSCAEGVCSAMATGSIVVKDPQLWWPWTMSSTPAYLYVFQVNKNDKSESNVYLCTPLKGLFLSFQKIIKLLKLDPRNSIKLWLKTID